MDLFSVVVIALVFLSLLVIIVIMARNLKRISTLEISEKKAEPYSHTTKKVGPIRRLFAFAIGFFQKLFLTIAEWTVKHAKKILLLVHFWIIKLKKGKNGNEELEDKEAARELISEEELNLNSIIHEELGKENESAVVIAKNRDDAPTQQANIESEEPKELPLERINVAETGRAAAENGEIKFSDKGKLSGKLARFFGKFPGIKKMKESKVSFSDQDGASDKSGSYGYENFDQSVFSDGVVKIEQPEVQQSDYLIKEVVVKKKAVEVEQDIDDKLGVDRRILEKKIVQKIANDPRGIENYRQLGELYIKMEEYQDAEEAYRHLVKLSPRDVDAKRKLEKIKLLKRLK